MKKDVQLFSLFLKKNITLLDFLLEPLNKRFLDFSSVELEIYKDVVIVKNNCQSLKLNQFKRSIFSV